MNSITKLPAHSFELKAKQDMFKTKATERKQKTVANRVAKITLIILSCIIFPIGLGILAVKCVKWILPGVIVPASKKFNIHTKSKKYQKTIKDLDQKREDFLSNHRNQAEQKTIRTADGVDIDTLRFKNKNHTDKWIVFFCGNNFTYESFLKDLKQISIETGANILIGNYRGIMRSRGKISSSHHLVLDGEAMVQSLLQEEVKPENILVHGWSLGGAVATEVVSHHKKMNLCNDRSFASLQDISKKKFGSILGTLIGKMGWIAGWRFNSIKNYRKVDGYKFIIHTKHDRVIHYKVSLYKRLKELIKKIKRRQKDIIVEHTHKKNRIKLKPNQKKCMHGIPITRLSDSFKTYTKNVKEALVLT